jgi:hypothetical protein
MERQEHIQTLQYNRRKFWASLAKLYLDKTEKLKGTRTFWISIYKGA